MTGQHQSAGSATSELVPTSMRAPVARRYGTAEMITVEHVPVPTPGEDEVLVAVEASSLNALDWHFLTGTPYLIRPTAGWRRPKRLIPGADVSGVVVAVGSSVDSFAVGDAVFGECEGGGCAPYLAANVSRIVAKPDGVSFLDAGATPVAGLTALQALRTHAEVQPGDRVLINGAAGGVGTFAVQIALALGAEVTAVCSSRNIEMGRALGATSVVDYTVDDIVERTAHGEPYDVMIDNVGNHAAGDCLEMLNENGRYVAVSGPKDNRWLGPVPHVARVALAFWRADPSFHQFVAAPNHEDLTELGRLLATGAVAPQVDRVIGVDEVADGLVEIGGGHARAKIVVVPT